MTYVETIEPRLTPIRRVAPTGAAEVLTEWCRDLTEELSARLALVSKEDLAWQPHPDSNSVNVTVWHVARWLDVLGSRAFTGKPAEADCWHQFGWRDVTDYEPDGVGYLGLGTLTGYTPEQMRAVPVLDSTSLQTYLAQTAERLIEQIAIVGNRLHKPVKDEQPSPYQQIAMTLQGSFGHVGEIDTLVALRSRLSTSPPSQP